MDWIVGGVEIQGDVCWWFVMGIEEEVDEQFFDGFWIVVDVVIVFSIFGGMFQLVQCVFVGQWCIVGMVCFQVVKYCVQYWIVVQFVVVVYIFIVKCDGEDVLVDQGCYVVYDLVCKVIILEIGGKVIY